MTIPSLMTKYEKSRTEKQLVKFYSTINQAVRLSVAENGTPEGWITRRKDYSYDETVEFLQTYIFPYLKYSTYGQCKNYPGSNNVIAYNLNRKVCVTLLDGGAFSLMIDNNGADLQYYTIGGNCPLFSGKYVPNPQRWAFMFQFTKSTLNQGNSYKSTDFVEPYIFEWDGNRDRLYTTSGFGCNKASNLWYCTKLIQLNSWKIPDDFPW